MDDWSNMFTFLTFLCNGDLIIWKIKQYKLTEPQSTYPFDLKNYILSKAEAILKICQPWVWASLESSAVEIIKLKLGQLEFSGVIQEFSRVIEQLVQRVFSRLS